MYLKSLEITNFRKFGTKNNKIEFVQSDYKKTLNESPEQPKSQSFVACATTLIIGKNNAGKTTVTKALKLVIDNEKIVGATFNLTYINNLFDQYTKVFTNYIDEGLGEVYKKEFEKIQLPKMQFKLIIGLNDDPKSYTVQNLSKIIPVEYSEIKNEVVLNVAFMVTEDEQFKKQIYKIFSRAAEGGLTVKFSNFLKVITATKFSKHLFDIKGHQISSTTFNINSLFDLKTIKANLDDGDTSLSSVFNKIVQYRLKNEEDPSRIMLEDEISRINGFMDDHIGQSHKEVVNNVVSEITDKKNMLVHLRSDLDFESLFKKLISYEFQENNNFIPENQFGLGYSNLMKILGQIIDYVEQYDDSETHDKINLICIEEPENFMHPQMQELFIKNIDDALTALLGDAKKKNINSQLLITTHSSHIVNSKIHSSKTFNNINYITTDKENFSHVVTLNDSKVRDNKNVLGTDDNSKNDLKFLKKHIKYKVSELFFSDAIILVEGITEEHILQHYINETYPLNKYGISIFNITGAYAHIYKPLIDLLKIPCLVITDLDVKRSGAEKGKEKPAVYTQISKLEGHETTNAVLHRYICKKEDLNDIEQPDEDESKSVLLPNDIDYFTEGNFKVVFQKDPIHGYIASSFEEAYILTNHKNDILNEVLKELKPRIYNRIVCDGDKENRDNSKNKSFEWQCKLSSSKSDFSNRLLYQIIITDEKLSPAPLLPTYIMDGLTWLSENINAPSAVKEEG